MTDPHELRETNRRGESYRVVASAEDEPGAFKRVDEDGNGVSRPPAPEVDENPVEQFTSDVECSCGASFPRWGDGRRHLLDVMDDEEAEVSRA